MYISWATRYTYTKYSVLLQVFCAPKDICILNIYYVFLHELYTVLTRDIRYQSESNHTYTTIHIIMHTSQHADA